MIRLGGGLGLGSIVLLVLGTEWHILFNVIAGAPISAATDHAGRWPQRLTPLLFSGPSGTTEGMPFPEPFMTDPSYSEITIFPGAVPVEKGEPVMTVGAPVDGL